MMAVTKGGIGVTKSVALYVRVSSERQAQQATIESQLAAVRERGARRARGAP
jgi:hypothetical protein